MLNKDDCQVLRGLAIISIVVHNYCHLMPGAVHENEFWFDSNNNKYFIYHLFSSDFFIHLFSFWGHLGVPVFVFLTAYGLTIKYSNVTFMKMGTGKFIWLHYKKLIIPLLFGMMFFLFVYFLKKGELWADWWQTLLAQMAMIANLSLHPDCYIVPGPYWYFGLTMQFYVIYRILIYGRPRYMVVIILILGIIVLLITESHRYALIWVKYNSFGWLLPFAIGLWMPTFSSIPIVNKSQWGFCLICSSVIMFVFARNYYLWILVPLCSLLFFVSLSQIISGMVRQVVLFLGNISLFIFVTHPIIREVIIDMIPSDYLYVGLFFYLFLVVSLSWIISLIPNFMGSFIYSR